MFKRKYFLDSSDLQYKQVKLPWKSKLMRFVLWAIACIAVTLLYTTVYNKMFGSMKEKVLSQEVEDMKLRYSIMRMKIDNSLEVLDDLELSDGNRYRPVLEMDSVPASVRKMGTGGVNKYEELDGYDNSNLMIIARKQLDEIKNRSTMQYESFRAIEERKNE